MRTCAQLVSYEVALALSVLGVVMMGLGAYVAVRPMFVRGVTLTGYVWLDAAFALVFLVRGWMNVRRALNRNAA